MLTRSIQGLAAGLLIVVFSLAGWAAETKKAAPAKKEKTPQVVFQTMEASFESLSEDKTSLFVLYKSKSLRLQVDKELQARLKNLKPDDVLLQKGNVLALEVAAEKGGKILKELSLATRPVTRERRVWVFLASVLVLLIISLPFVGWNPTSLILGQDNRYSNSKFQVTVWFLILLASYFSTVWLRWMEGGGDFIGGVNIPENLLILSGISAFTLGAAKGITTAKDQKGAQAPAGTPDAVRKERAQAPNFLLDLSHDDNGATDIGDFQMVVITLVAVVVYVASVLKFLGNIGLVKVVTLPDVDTTILATFGLGQGAYLTKKYAGRAGDA